MPANSTRLFMNPHKYVSLLLLCPNLFLSLDVFFLLPALVRFNPSLAAVQYTLWSTVGSYPLSAFDTQPFAGMGRQGALSRAASALLV